MSTIDRQVVLETLSRLVTPGIKLTALADELGAHKQHYAELRELLLDLVEEGRVHVLTGGAFALAPSGRAADAGGKPAPRAARGKPASKAAKPAKPEAKTDGKADKKAVGKKTAAGKAKAATPRT